MKNLEKHRISDHEPGCGGKTCWTKRLVKEADMSDVWDWLAKEEGRLSVAEEGGDQKKQSVLV